ncbi:MAG TPA: hypothetical protein VN672_02835 [Solirubrobacteraceae bacterium]|nr:hypothetical protein [Solirubrobacteraceae bacterium]
MGKTRHWLLFAVGSLGIAVCSLLAVPAATPAERDSAPIREQSWKTATFSSLLEPSGPPEYGRCIKTTGGGYTDAGCTTSGSPGAYEWYSAFGSARPLEKTRFSGVIKEATTAKLETVNKNVITCTGETVNGKYTGNKTLGEVFVTFTGCSAFGTTCTSPGAAAGTIATNQLEGVLGIETLGAEPVLNKIGEDLFPVGHTGAIGEFSCGGVKVVMSGSIISPVAENAMKLTTTITAKQSKGKQNPENFIGETPEPLMATIESGTPEQGGEALQTQQTNEEKVEINTVV